MEEIISAIDKQIALLQSAKAALIGSDTPIVATGKRRGRPPGITNKKRKSAKLATKRVLSDEGKAKIAAAQKARWAAVRKAAKPVAKTAAAKPRSKKTIVKKAAAKLVEPKKEATTAA